MKTILRSFCLLTLLLFISLSAVSQQYSAFQKAEIINSLEPGFFKFYINNQESYNALTIKRGLSQKDALATFKLMNQLQALDPSYAPFEVYKGLAGIEVTDLSLSFLDIFQRVYKGDTTLQVPNSTFTESELSHKIQVSLTSAANEEGATTNTEDVSGANFTSNLLQAAADLLIDRAKQELTNAYFNKLRYKLDSILALNMMFPNTTQILKSVDPFSIPSLAATWKSSFELDLQALPKNGIDYLILVEKDTAKKKELEVIQSFLGLVKDLESGDHLYEALRSFNAGLPSTDIKKYMQIITTTSDALLKQEGSDVWVTAADFRSLGNRGRAIFFALYAKDINDLGLNTSLLNPDLYYKVESEISSFVTHFDMAQKAINDAKNSQDAAVIKTSFVNLSNAAFDLFGDLKDVVTTLKIEIQADGELISLTDVSAKIDNLNEILNIIKESEQHIVKKEYGALIPQFVKIFDLIDTKKKVEFENLFELVSQEYISWISKEINISSADEEILKMFVTNYQIPDLEELNIPAQIKKFKSAFNKQLIALELKDKYREALYNQVDVIFAEMKIPIPEEFMKIATLISDLTNAKTKEEMQSILDAAILPVGSYKMKRQPSARALYLQGFTGLAGGYEFLNEDQINGDYEGGFGGLFLSIGMEYTKGTRGLGYSGWYMSLLDLGAIGSFSLSKDSEDLDIPSLSIENVLSPGIFKTWGLANAPISVGIGGRYSPELREISVADGSTQAELNGKLLGGAQVLAFIGVDIPLVRIFKR